MSIINDRIDLEDVKQPPLQSAGMRRESTSRIGLERRQTASFGDLKTLGDLYSVGEQNIYYSFSQCITNEVPPHYRQYYVSYDNCKSLIKYLDAANEAFQKGINCNSTIIPLKIRRMLNDSLQSLLVARASSIDEGVVRALVPQVVFSDIVRQELDKVNNFGAITYNRIEISIRNACRRIRELIAIDKARVENQQIADHGEAPSPLSSVCSAESPDLSKALSNGHVSSSASVSFGHFQNQLMNSFRRRDSRSGPSNHQSTVIPSQSPDDDEHSSAINASPLEIPLRIPLNHQSESLHQFIDFSPHGSSSLSQYGSIDSTPQSSSLPTTISQNSKLTMSEPEYQEWRNEQLTELEEILDSEAAEIIHLDMFSRLNYKGFIRLAGLFDKVMGTTILPWTSANVLRELFANVDLDRLLIFLSVSWDKYRIALKREYATEASTWKPPESFIRSTTKYWIRPDQVMKTKLAIIKHMPYLIFGCSNDDLEAYVDPFMEFTEPLESSESIRPVPTKPAGTPEESQLVSSIYLDSPLTAYSYGRRIVRLEGAELVRFRWYGHNGGEPNKEIFIERKTHHESWTGDFSAKQRFSLPQRKVFEFMKGKLNIDEWSQKESENRKKELTEKKLRNMRSLGHEIEDLIIREGLQPMVRTSYLRAAFQLSTSNDVRFSLDTNLCMVDELIPNGHPFEPWCRVGEEICGKDQVVRFPYAVLEVKLRALQPPWVSNILADVGAIMVYKFSKFQHGMAFLHRPLVNHLGVPHWISDFESHGWGAGYAGSPPFDLTSDVGRRYTLGSLSTSSGTKPGQQQIAPKESETAEQHQGAWSGIKGSFMSWFTRTTETYGSSQHPPEDFPQLFIRDRPSPSITSIQSIGIKDTFSGYGLKRLYDQTKKVSVTGQLIHPKDFPKMTLQWMKPISDTLARDDVLKLIYRRSKNIRKIDPKSYFAAERTFLHYLQKALYLAALAIALLSLGSKKAQSVGVMLGAMSLVIICYSFYVFKKRSNKLDKRLTRAPDEDCERLDSKWGPIVIFTMVTATIIMAIGINLISHSIQLPGHIKPQRRKHQGTPLSRLGASIIAGIENQLDQILSPAEVAFHAGLRGIINGILGVGSLT